VLEFPLPSSCLFFLHHLPPCSIFLHLWQFFAIRSMHQEAQAVKFNCSCTSGFTGCSYFLPSLKFNCSCTSGLPRLQLSSTVFQVQLLAYFRTSQASFVFYHFSSSIVTVLPDFSGYNCFLRFFSSSTDFFQTFICSSASN
jgi:hypothetical protein